MCIVSRALYVSAGPLPSIGPQWQAPAVSGPTCHPPTTPAPPSKCRPRPKGAAPAAVAGAGPLPPRSRGAAHQPDQARHQHNLRPLQILHRGPVSFPARSWSAASSIKGGARRLSCFPSGWFGLYFMFQGGGLECGLQLHIQPRLPAAVPCRDQR